MVGTHGRGEGRSAPGVHRQLANFQALVHALDVPHSQKGSGLSRQDVLCHLLREQRDDGIRCQSSAASGKFKPTEALARFAKSGTQASAAVFSPTGETRRRSSWEGFMRAVSQTPACAYMHGATE